MKKRKRSSKTDNIIEADQIEEDFQFGAKNDFRDFVEMKPNNPYIVSYEKFL